MAWQKEGGDLPQARSRDDGQGILVITDVRTSDSGTYLCVATDEYTVVSERAVLTVGGIYYFFYLLISLIFFIKLNLALKVDIFEMKVINTQNYMKY